jgi:hypothetical protein
MKGLLCDNLYVYLYIFICNLKLDYKILFKYFGGRIFRVISQIGKCSNMKKISIKFMSQLKLNWLTFNITWNAHEIDLHLRFNWDLNLVIEVCATQSRLISLEEQIFFWRFRNHRLCKLFYPNFVCIFSIEFVWRKKILSGIYQQICCSSYLFTDIMGPIPKFWNFNWSQILMRFYFFYIPYEIYFLYFSDVFEQTLCGIWDKRD